MATLARLVLLAAVHAPKRLLALATAAACLLQGAAGAVCGCAAPCSASAAGSACAPKVNSAAEPNKCVQLKYGAWSGASAFENGAFLKQAGTTDPARGLCYCPVGTTDSSRASCSVFPRAEITSPSQCVGALMECKRTKLQCRALHAR